MVCIYHDLWRDQSFALLRLSLDRNSAGGLLVPPWYYSPSRRKLTSVMFEIYIS